MEIIDMLKEIQMGSFFLFCFMDFKIFLIAFGARKPTSEREINKDT